MTPQQQEIKRLHSVIRNMENAPDSPFLKFWHTVNAILRSRGQPDMLFGEAHDWWDQHKNG